ncbi:MAG TPA: hypothetical protein PK271_02060 [Hyphomicrobium sp.]|uniref:hypothetical protein n=1 Tax=Hyphomicrobium sp. TaxID=82 RepID=UPI002BE8E089|nr:hypothetical protein [Hyphomicrobium sp.]HRN87365.1 hypothetical protein [Hyphomicrobium sp.]
MQGPEIAAIEARRMICQQEDFAVLEDATPLPSREWLAYGCGTGNELAAHEDVWSEPADAVAYGASDRLDKEG